MKQDHSLIISQFVGFDLEELDFNITIKSQLVVNTCSTVSTYVQLQSPQQVYLPS